MSDPSLTVAANAPPAVIEVGGQAYTIVLETEAPIIETVIPAVKIVEIATAGIQGAKGDKGEDGALVIKRITKTDIDNLFA